MLGAEVMEIKGEPGTTLGIQVQELLKERWHQKVAGTSLKEISVAKAGRIWDPNNDVVGF